MEEVLLDTNLEEIKLMPDDFDVSDENSSIRIESKRILDAVTKEANKTRSQAVKDEVVVSKKVAKLNPKALKSLKIQQTIVQQTVSQSQADLYFEVFFTTH